MHCTILNNNIINKNKTCVTAITKKYTVYWQTICQGKYKNAKLISKALTIKRNSKSIQAYTSIY